MKLTKCFICLGLLFFSISLQAKTLSLNELFKDKSVCFFLFDLNKQEMLQDFNDLRCHDRMPADSTFKIPLSLMAFDQKLITQETIFHWDKKDKGLAEWNQDQTPKTWLSNSVVWVSQTLTPKLGLTKILQYLKKFDYGNQDFSGDAGKNNGLTQAWLNSSLQISGDEQLDFLFKLLTKKLPVSSIAMQNTIDNMYLETLANGWKLYGKTGSAGKDGWFVGFIQKSNKIDIFVLNFTDLVQTNTNEPNGLRAKALIKDILSQSKL